MGNMGEGTMQRSGTRSTPHGDIGCQVAAFTETVMTAVDPCGRLLAPGDADGYKGREYGLCLCTGDYSELEFDCVLPGKHDEAIRVRIEFKAIGTDFHETVVCSHVFDAEDTGTAIEWIRKCMDVLDAYPMPDELLQGK